MVNLLSLGCPKNRADSESLLRGLRRGGVCLTSDPDEASVLVINTCGFIEDAKKESINEILRLSGLKSNGKRLVVMGCLSERYRDELVREIPEIDAVFGVGEEEKIIAYCREALNLNGSDMGANGLEGEPVLYGSEAMGSAAPLKVAEGCDRACTFCVIPSIRGRFRSREPEEILSEAEGYVNAGAKELMLVAQDLTGYGRDLDGYNLPRLIRDVASVTGDFWVRPFYLYPTAITDELVATINDEEKVCTYFDIPFQHSEDRVLRLMGRGGSRASHLKVLERIRSAVPGATLRTTFIVGFPGETDEDFEALLDFVEETRFDRLGAFKYSHEEGTPAAELPGQVPDGVKEERYDALMRLQADISLEINEALVGRRERALIEAVEGEAAIGRIASQAHGIDGVTVIRGRGLTAGTFVDVKITGASDYDLEAEPV